jgi:hypothetical protein
VVCTFTASQPAAYTSNICIVSNSATAAADNDALIQI